MVSSEHRSTHGGIPAVQGERPRVPLEHRRSCGTSAPPSVRSLTSGWSWRRR